MAEVPRTICCEYEQAECEYESSDANQPHTVDSNGGINFHEMDADKIREICTTWVSNFSKPLSSDFTEEDFLSSFHPEVEWFDHAFHVRRVGHKAILGLRTSFLHCNQPFRSELKAIHPTATGAVVEQLWIGCCKNDIVRPDGEVAVKASGRNFENYVCFVLDIDEDGRIVKLQEFYNKRWDEGVNMASYHTMKGASLKT